MLPSLNLIDHSIYTVIGSIFASLWIFVFGFLRVLEKKSVREKNNFSILSLLIIIILLKSLALTSNLLLAGFFLLFLSSDKQFARSIFGFLAVMTRFEIVFLLVALEMVRKNWSSITSILFSLLISASLAVKFDQVRFLRNYSLEILGMIFLITFSTLLYKRMKKIRNLFSFEIYLSPVHICNFVP